jgi:hypothetical protein
MEIGTQTEHVLRNFDNGDDDGSEPIGELLFDGAEICMVVLREAGIHTGGTIFGVQTLIGQRFMESRPTLEAQ